MNKIKVLIVARTRTNNDQMRCIGGLAWEENEAQCYSVRLMNPRDLYRGRIIRRGFKGFWDTSAPYRIGDVWELTVRELEQKIPPHVEDVIVEDAILLKKIRVSEMYDRILYMLQKSRLPILWRGDPNNLFDGKIQFNKNGKGYIDKNNVSKCSTGFWLPDKNLYKSYDSNNKLCYRYKADNNRLYYIPYVGVFSKTPPVIKEGSLIRVSLSRWHRETEMCWLMISGWFEPPHPRLSCDLYG
ncbi:dual OB domain-containing protein [Rhodothermus marinus]|uniref:dual OB domain-containing protein n=1 Tax=Rhodothermus marinus TaxID=29549 RepID=UPI0012BA3F77|nr:hypothetical protein [Rhodothermus marinus]BBM69630.1 hypothetical protein RmaAA213_14760 [Rhodothermus marinus]BBM72612.1 hypothetical protein RmaAA338_14770 [Rhodothermus marinus]